MSANPWTREQIELLIEEYRQHPILYSLKDKYYHNRKLRAVAVNEILRKVRTLRPKAQENDILRKIRSIRTNYASERRKQLNSIKDITSDSEIYQPSWWYYNMLTFLNDNIQLREREKDCDDEDPKKIQSGPKIKTQDESFLDEINFQDSSSGFRSISPDPVSELDTELKFTNEDVEPPLKQQRLEVASQYYSTDSDDNSWLHYLSSLLGQIKDSRNKVLLRHRVTNLMYEEIEKQMSTNI